MGVEPVKKLKVVCAIKGFLDNSSRNFCLFVMGNSIHVRAFDILQLTTRQVEKVKNGKIIELIEKKTKKRR